MSDAALTFEEALANAGFVAKWEARGEARGENRKAAEIAKNLLENGFSVEQTAKFAKLDIKQVKALQK